MWVRVGVRDGKFDKGDCSLGDGYNVWVGVSDKDFVWYGGGGLLCSEAREVS